LAAFGAVGAAIASLLIVDPASAAYVSTNPPAYNNGTTPDPQSVGSITLYDAAGNTVTSGALSNLGGAIYAVASSTPRANTIKAQLSIAAPDHTKVSTLWASQAMSASTVFPVTAVGAPAAVTGATGPVVTLNGTTDGSLSSFLNVAQLDTTAGYQGYAQLRVKDSGPGVPAASTWATMEIAFDLVAGTWQQVYPAPAAQGTTASTPTPSLASPQNAGTAITLSSTVTPAVAGTMAFYDYGVAIPSATAVTVDGSGVATTPSFAPTTGDHDFTAIFTPTDPAYSASPVSGDLIYSIIAVVSAPVSQAPGTTTTGSFVVDQTLTCVQGPWNNQPTSYAYSWWLNGSQIAGKTTNKLTLTAAMVGKSVVCRVTATNTGGSAYDDSPVGVVHAANFVNKTKPAITGVAKVGKVLTASTGTWTPAGTSYTYVWKRGAVIVGKAKTYKATVKDKGKLLTVTVTAIRAGYNSKAVTSASKKIG
jgi:hypothetical protein